MLVEIFLVLILGISTGWLGKLIGFPSAFVQVILGALLGPSILGWISTVDVLHLLAQTGVILFLAMAGMQIGLDKLIAAGRPTWWVAILGMLLPH